MQVYSSEYELSNLNERVQVGLRRGESDGENKEARRSRLLVSSEGSHSELLK